jgi:hypothetical protein
MWMGVEETIDNLDHVGGYVYERTLEYFNVLYPVTWMKL